MTLKNASVRAEIASEYWTKVIARENPDIDEKILKIFKSYVNKLIMNKIYNLEDNEFLWIKSKSGYKNRNDIIHVALVNSGITILKNKITIPSHYTMGICRNYISVSEGQAKPYKIIYNW